MSLRVTDKISENANLNSVFTAPRRNNLDAFKSILAQKLSTVEEDLDKMNEEKAEEKAISDILNAPETIRRIMPDGSIVITKYFGGKVESREHLAPHLELVVDGNGKEKLVPKHDPLRDLF